MRMEQETQEDTGPPAPDSPPNPVLSPLVLSLVGNGALRAPPVPGVIAELCQGPVN